MHFSRLRLSGFKSFVEPTEFLIEPGLTGVVGPNGCGKSNLLEALRWVMGASSAKAMRGEGMDDVIFAGSGDRPSRNFAEVSLTIDNQEGRAPGQFAAQPVLEVTRRIDRGEGSTYRVNGVESRARDVQLLFADASTGANSPALVRQGQISELIAAKPQNRRRILEEAAGVSGLYGRRHEAQLRVKAAEANLTRLDDVARELESGLGRLRREARTAARYRKLAADIRGLQSALLYSRWAEASRTVEAAEADATAARTAAEAATRVAATATTTALLAQESLPALRDEDTAASAVVHHLDIEIDRQDRALADARAEVERWSGELKRIAADVLREDQTADDASRMLARLTAEIAQVEADMAAAPERTPELEAAARQADEALRAAQGVLEAAAAEQAARQAERRATREAVEAAKARLARVDQALATAEAERRSHGAPDHAGLKALEQQALAAEAALNKTRADLELAEQARGEAGKQESETRHAARALEDALGRLAAEAKGLASLAAPTEKAPYPTALDAVQPQPGLEAALAAALGDDLNAALDARARSFWAGRDSPAPAWPKGVTRLADGVKAPPELAARLAHTGLVAPEDGARLQGQLPPGARLVSRQGDLWRWDGLTVTAAAPRPSQVRLEQRNRLTALADEITALQPELASAKAAHAAAVAAQSKADQLVRDARSRPRDAELALARARDRLEQARRDADRLEARIQALDETLDRFRGEQREAATAFEAAQALAAAAPEDKMDGQSLDAARAAAARAREAAFEARAAVDREVAVRGGRKRRLEALQRDHAEWSRRSRAANERREVLRSERTRAEQALAAAEAPAAIEARRVKLADEADQARARKARAGDALAAAETQRAEADRAAKAADADAANTREARAAADARLEGAVERLREHARALIDASGLEPAALAAKLADEAIGAPADAAGAEALLSGLERERDALGAVNLLADQEVAEVTARLEKMSEERADLAGALTRLRQAIDELNAEGRERLMTAFEVIDQHFRDLFTTLFEGGSAELRLVESDDPLEAGLEILACPPGKRMAVMSLMSGGEQALTAVALIFAVFLANPSPICVLDEVDAPLDDANVERFCNLLSEMRRRSATRFLTITHNALTMSRMDRLFGVTMRERGVSQLVSVDLREAEALAAQ